ncbi:MAG: hypothetical protein KBF99_01215 [Leptospiraceae bacterium]|nr:hypothetical protein [Leptospiraceae bacterium]MBK7058098.1 hypothetical protein [Leptospiraceae bacterium]MBK9501757.1 hypothetical protein [Leptospiraceae bacterium]MBL0266770.1 hypothetical protein [Leptospiraceae bacterium]MBP9161764.1 hypothetical protein [Leptospiraceae bacterium]
MAEDHFSQNHSQKLNYYYSYAPFSFQNLHHLHFHCLRQATNSAFWTQRAFSFSRQKKKQNTQLQEKPILQFQERLYYLS